MKFDNRFKEGDVVSYKDKPYTIVMTIFDVHVCAPLNANISSMGPPSLLIDDLLGSSEQSGYVYLADSDLIPYDYEFDATIKKL